MPNLRNLLALPVVSLETGSQVGAVEEFIIDAKLAEIKALLTVKPDFSQDAQNILTTKEEIIYGVFWQQIFSIGPDAVMVRSDRVVKNLTLYCRENGCRYAGNLFDKPIYTDSGFSLGVLNDIIFDQTTGEIKNYQVSDGIFSDLIYGRRMMPPPKAMLDGKEMLIVPDNIL
ncbi:MAG: PRC-barrel domain-containing protein [Sporomusaceae bacterium]|jgi:uncharacterized protein YrrD|nr:PRC-barrel domain-containing protein [Sporomusaceae bacterium]